MNARGPAVCRDRKRIGLLNQKSSGKIFFGGSWLPSDMEKRFSLFWFPRLFPEPARIRQLSRRRLNCPATCCWRSPVILQTDWKNVQMRHLTDDFQLRVLTRGAICPSLPPKPEKIFFFGYRTLIFSGVVVEGGGGSSNWQLRRSYHVFPTWFFLSFLIFLCLWKSRFMSKHQPRALATPCAHHLVPIKHKTPSLRLQSSTH